MAAVCRLSFTGKGGVVAAEGYQWQSGWSSKKMTPPQSRRYVCTGSRGGVSGPPVTPCKIRSFTSIQMVHTHTLSHTQRLLHTEAFTDKHFHTQRPDSWNRNLASVFGDQTSFRAKGFAGPFAKSQFYLISCERVAPGTRESAILPQFWAFWAIGLHFLAKGLRPDPRKRNFTAVFGLFGDRTSFRAKGLRPDPAVLGFLAIELRFVRKGLRFAPSRWHCPRAFKREIEKKERARGQESKRARENVKMWRWEDGKMRRCEDLMMWRWRGQERMWRCEDEKMSRCEDEKMWRCEDEKIWRWTDVKMRRWWEDVKMRRCEDEQMWRWEDVKMRRCEDCKMLCKDVNMWKMLDRPPHC